MSKIVVCPHCQASVEAGEPPEPGVAWPCPKCGASLHPSGGLPIAQPVTPGATIGGLGDLAKKLRLEDPKRRRLFLVGGIAGALVLSCCVVSTGSLGIWALSHAWSNNSTSGVGKKLVGTWKGKTNWILGTIYTKFEFKSNGTVEWTQNLGKEDGELFNRGSGTWKVDRVEGDNIFVHMVNDREPDRTWGWTITLKGDDRFTIEGFEDFPVTVERKR
jgi:hypothetical protein